MHSLQEILLETRKNSKMCAAVERGGIICYGIVECKGICQKHYQRYKKYQSYDLPNKEIKKCKFIDCNKKHNAHGYCLAHYNKCIKSKRKKICTVEGCEKKIESNGLCSKHRMRWRRHGDVNTVKSAGNGEHLPLGASRKYTEDTKCLVKGCNVFYTKRHTLVRGLCCTHYKRWYKYKDFTITHKREYVKKLNIT